MAGIYRRNSITSGLWDAPLAPDQLKFLRDSLSLGAYNPADKLKVSPTADHRVPQLCTAGLMLTGRRNRTI